MISEVKRTLHNRAGGGVVIASLVVECAAGEKDRFTASVQIMPADGEESTEWSYGPFGSGCEAAAVVNPILRRLTGRGKGEGDDIAG